MSSFGPESLRWWFPRVVRLGIPHPPTLVVPVDCATVKRFCLLDCDLGSETTNALRLGALRLGFPLILRTDITSYKHGWEHSCFVPSARSLLEHARNVATFSILAGGEELATSAFVLRKFVPLDSTFLAFSGRMPVSAERRYFISNGAVVCHHPYWTEDAIKCPSATDWRERLALLNSESSREIGVLSGYAGKVAKDFSGSWSVDFARTLEGTWLLLDMAPAARSSRPNPSCVYCSRLVLGQQQD